MKTIACTSVALFGAAAALPAETVFDVGPRGLPSLVAARDAMREARAAGNPGPFRITVEEGMRTHAGTARPGGGGLRHGGTAGRDRPPPVRARCFRAGRNWISSARKPGGVRVYWPGGLAPESGIGPHRRSRPAIPTGGFFLLAGGTVRGGLQRGGAHRAECAARRVREAGVRARIPGRGAHRRVAQMGLHAMELDDVDPARGTMAATAHAMKPWNPLKEGTRFWLENHGAFLDDPGEWFASGGELRVVWPEGMDPATPVTAGVLPRLVSIEGTAENPVHDIVFRGLGFRHSAASPPQHEPRQASVYAPVMIGAEHARRIVFDRCDVTHTGGTACGSARTCATAG
ncbi:MAG: hypothetical protein U1G05_01725 [Kiritimatiellia bacterium]